MNFSDEQMRAIRHGGGPALVLSGPGAGKTTVITNRILHLIREEAVAPSEILVITFTDAAASEMKRRFLCLSADLQGAGRVVFGTFHAVFLSVLRSRYRLHHVVADEDDQRRILEQVLEEHSGQTEGQSLSETAALLLPAIAAVKNNPETKPPAYMDETAFYGLADAYGKTLRENGRMDFDDILLLTRRLFHMEPEILAKYRKRWRYLLVDEFQDSSPIQYELVSMLSGDARNLFVVGDDDQAIYGFRGSSPACMQRFLKDYPDAKKYLLSVNHRCAKGIVALSQHLIRHNRNRMNRELVSGRDREGKIVYTRYRSIREEAEAVRSFVSSFRRHGIPDSEMAVLCRNVRELSMIRSVVAAGKEPSEIRFLTYHKSKGLEFAVVFLPCLNAGIVPSAVSAANGGSEEERRTFYVAVTRAKDYLLLSRFETRSKREVPASPFLRELGLSDCQ